jgi:hypothetical protein
MEIPDDNAYTSWAHYSTPDGIRADVPRWLRFMYAPHLLWWSKTPVGGWNEIRVHVNFDGIYLVHDTFGNLPKADVEACRIVVVTQRSRHVEPEHPVKLMVGDTVTFLILAPSGKRVGNTGSWTTNARFFKNYNMGLQEGAVVRHTAEDKSWVSWSGFFPDGKFTGRRIAVAYRQPFGDGFKSKHVFVDVYRPRAKLKTEIGKVMVNKANKLTGAEICLNDIHSNSLLKNTSVTMPLAMRNASGHTNFLQLYSANRVHPWTSPEYHMFAELGRQERLRFLRE